MKKIPVYLLVPLFILVSCGGGGGSASPESPAIPLPTINFSSNQSGELDVGSEYSFSWTTSNAQSCSTSGDWNITVNTNGSHNVTLNESKTYSFTLRCLNSEGASTSKSIIITANYLLIGGTIIHKDNTDRTVYIDQNQNRIFDSYEYSGSSDSNGNFQIRSSENIECLKNYPVAVNNSYLYSINPTQNQTNVIISSFTSLFKSFTSSGLFNLSADLYNSKTPCNIYDSNNQAHITNQFDSAIELQKNITGYSYSDIKQNPSNSPKPAIVTSRFNELDSFYQSLAQIESDIVTNVKSLLDSSLSGTGFSSNDYTIRSTSDLHYSNLLIFLNENDYPESLWWGEQVSSVDDISLRGDFMVDLDPNSNISMANLNGWDESFVIHINPMFITNDNKLMRDNSSCYVNPSSYCTLDIASDLFGDDSAALYDSEISYLLQKETSRGLERMETDEYINSKENTCEVYKNYIITDTNNYDDDSYSIDMYRNRITDLWLDYEGSCDSAYYSPNYKWMTSAKFYNDSSSVFLSWDNETIDNLPNAYGILEFDQDSLPPDQIGNEYINEFLNKPDVGSFKNNEFNMTSELLSTVADEMWNYASEKALQGPFGWVGYYVENVNGGTAYATIESTNWTWYVSCYQNGETIFSYSLDEYSASAYLLECLQTQSISSRDDGYEFIFSRSSTHTEDNTDYTFGPYVGRVNTYEAVPQSNLSIQTKTEPNEMLEEKKFERLKRDQIQSSSNIKR